MNLEALEQKAPIVRKLADAQEVSPGSELDQSILWEDGRGA